MALSFIYMIVMRLVSQGVLSLKYGGIFFTV